MKFSSENLNRVFEEIDYEGFKNLLFDVAADREIQGEKGIVSKTDANDKIRNVCFNILGLDKDSSKRDIKRAMKRHGVELYEIIEEVIDLAVETGFRESEFFNDFVEERNLKEGDANEFWTDDKVILSVAKVSGDHHDLTIQTLGSGTPYSIPISYYAVKVGKDIDLFLTGRLDWSKFVNAVAKAFVVKIQNELYAEVMNADSKLPNSSQFKKSGVLGSATKETFDQLIEDVGTANGNVPVVIMGTKAALKKLNALSDVNWRSDSQKESVATTGRLGDYEGTDLIEIPQRFKDNDVTQKLVANDKLLIMPQVDNKFAKFVTTGETEIEENEKGGYNNDDLHTLEITRGMGISTVIGRYFGSWTILTQNGQQ